MWKNMLNIVIGSGLLLVGPGGPAASVDPVEPPTIEFIDVPPEFVEMVDWALDLFNQADLKMPPLRVVHHRGDLKPCRGRDGLHHAVDGVNVIELCAIEATFPTQVMILHEMAHAWIDHQLTDERKIQFKELRGWEFWRNYEAAPWHENGTEQAAEIMVWGLIDRPIRMIRIYQASCDELEVGYSTLTGVAPLNGHHDYC